MQSNLTSNNIYDEKWQLLKKRSLYLAQLFLFIKWFIKVRLVNPPDERFTVIIKSIWEILYKNDVFLINSLENKVRFILNKKN